MAHILISGLVNTETTLKIPGFPLEYYPIDYPFFGIHTSVSGVGYNIACAAATLGDRVSLYSMTGQDFQGAYIRDALRKRGIRDDGLLALLHQTPNSVILYEDSGRRQVWCDLKDIQQMSYPFDPSSLEGVDVVAACNIGFSRPLLAMAKAAGKIVATDVHVLSNVWDDYNRAFLEAADILFLSDEALGDGYRDFLRQLAGAYEAPIIVLGRGAEGAVLCWKETGKMYHLPAVQVGPVVNTVGAGDALFTAFLHYFARKPDPVEALTRAQLFASAKICANGGAEGFVDEQQIQIYYDQFAPRILAGMTQEDLW